MVLTGAASVARAWSGYVDSLTGGTLSNLTSDLMSGHEMSASLGHIPDPLACILCLVYALILGSGVKVSSRLNSVLTMVNLGVIGLVIGLGCQYANFGNWTDEKHYGFMPFGIAGVMAGNLF